MDTTSDAPILHKPGRHPRLDDADRAVLVEITRENPMLGADNLTKLFVHRTGKTCSDSTIRAALKKMGWRRLARPLEPTPVPSTLKDPVRYTSLHRREPSGISYPTDLTDEQWVLLEPHLRGSRNLPCSESTRATVNALLYMARTGCQWRFLPHDFPKWQAVAKTYYRWIDRGVWEKVNDALRREVRIAVGKDPEPSAGIIDSQSVKTTEKGGPPVTMRGRKSKDGNGISL